MPLTTDERESYADPSFGLPEVSQDLSCKGTPAVNPDVAVDVLDTRSGEWTRLPVTDVEVTRNKDGISDMMTTARVDFPAEWDGQDVLSNISGYNSLKTSVAPEGVGPTGETEIAPEDVYDACRIFFRDQVEDYWVLEHYGYIGGLGPTTDTGVFKFWVYDAADLMRGISVSKSFGEPTVQQVLNFVLDGVDERGADVGLRERSVFDNIDTTIIGEGASEIRAQKAGLDELQATIDVLGITPSLIFPDDVVTSVSEFLFGDEDTRSFFSGQKQFKSNRHNMGQLLNWFASQVDAQWYFEPTYTGPVLVFDITDDGPPRREFVDVELTDGDGFETNVSYTDGQNFGKVNVLNNNAIADIKPINTVRMKGATTRVPEQEFQGNSVGTVTVYGERYPVAKVTYQPLLQRAGGYEYGPTDVNTDAKTVSEAIARGKEEIRQHLNEATDGTIEITGDPHLSPYDYLTVVPVCNDIFPDADASPITYEVNAVRHRRKAGERYTTDVDVSFVFDETRLTTEGSYEKA